MSGLALGWAKKQSAPCPASKALLVLLGDYADEDGFAWPSIARMAKELQRSDRHVKRLLKSLTDCGRLYGFDVVDAGNGRTRPRVYFFPIGGEPPCASALRAYESKIGGRVTPVSPSLPDISKNEGEGDTGVTREGDTGVTGRVTRESPLELPLYPERDLTISLDASARAEVDAVGFDEALAAYPASGRGVTDVQSARDAWAEVVPKAGGVDRLLAAVRACAADPMLKRRDFGAPSFQRWLREDRWRAWLGEAEPSSPARIVWTGPDEVASAVASVMGPEARASYFDPARWDGARRAIITRTGYAADRLRSQAGKALRAIGVTVDCEASGQIGGGHG